MEYILGYGSVRDGKPARGGFKTLKHVNQLGVGPAHAVDPITDFAVCDAEITYIPPERPAFGGQLNQCRDCLAWLSAAGRNTST